MLTDARQILHGTVKHADACIVGGGPAGIAIARELAGSGVATVLLESGGLAEGGPAADLAKGESVGVSYFPLEHARANALGGTSNRWRFTQGFRTRPLDDVDLESRAGVHEGWPLTRQDLDPFYQRAHLVLGMGPFDYDVDRYVEPAVRPLLPLDPVLARTVLFRLLRTDGMARYANELQRAENVDVLLHANAVAFESTGDPRTVDRVRVATLSGVQFTVRAKTVVLAAGGIGNPRLLLLARNQRPAGLGNDNDLVGRFFMEHLNVRCATVVPAEGVELDTTFYERHEVGRDTVQGKLSPSQEVVRSNGMLNVTFFVERMRAARADPSIRSLSTLRQALSHRPRPQHLAAHALAVVRGTPTVARSIRSNEQFVVLRAMSEQSPNHESRVTLGKGKDALGLPRARLDWRLRRLDRWSISRAEEVVGEAIERAGLGTLRHRLDEARPTPQVTPQWHHMGTTRMGEDASDSVVDMDGRVHGSSNVYVAGSSVFPTGGFANPTLTIAALAIRLADHLLDVLGIERTVDITDSNVAR